MSTDWMDRASCRLDPNWTTIYAAGTTGRERELLPDRWKIAHLAAICNLCPVMARCAAYALENDCDGGMYAGVWVPFSGRAWGRSARMNGSWREARETLTAIATEGVAS